MTVVGLAIPMDERSCKPSSTMKEFSVRMNVGKELIQGEYRKMNVRARNP